MSERELLRHRYRHLLNGFEHFGFTEEQLVKAIGPFENCLLDMKSCQECDGRICKTTANRKSKTDWATGEFLGWDYSKQDGGRYFYALHPEGTALYKEPTFALFKCPGVVERKEQIFAIYRRVSNRENKARELQETLR